MVLADDNFASIVAAVEEGRIIFNRLRNVTFFLLLTCTAELMTLFLSVALYGESPLEPIQILWINLVTGAMVAIPLGLEPGIGNELSQPPRDRRVGLLYPGMLLRIGLTGLCMSLLVTWIFHHAPLPAGADVEAARRSSSLWAPSSRWSRSPESRSRCWWAARRPSRVRMRSLGRARRPKRCLRRPPPPHHRARELCRLAPHPRRARAVRSPAQRALEAQCPHCRRLRRSLGREPATRGGGVAVVVAAHGLGARGSNMPARPRSQSWRSVAPPGCPPSSSTRSPTSSRRSSMTSVRSRRSRATTSGRCWSWRASGNRWAAMT